MMPRELSVEEIIQETATEVCQRLGYPLTHGEKVAHLDNLLRHYDLNGKHSDLCYMIAELAKALGGRDSDDPTR